MHRAFESHKDSWPGRSCNCTSWQWRVLENLLVYMLLPSLVWNTVTGWNATKPKQHQVSQQIKQRGRGISAGPQSSQGWTAHNCGCLFKGTTGVRALLMEKPRHVISKLLILLNFPGIWFLLLPPKILSFVSGSQGEEHVQTRAVHVSRLVDMI